MNTRYELSWELAEETAGVARERSLAGCFVLLSNVPAEGEGALDAAGLLRTYKGHYGVESDFAFLKDPLVVNDLFLKTPSRIDALGMVLIITLMVWRLMERTRRAHVENAKTTLPGWDHRDTTKPPHPGATGDWPVVEQHAALRQKLLGHYGYYGITGNARWLANSLHEVERVWHRWLARRGSRFNWERGHRLLARYPLPPIRVVHSVSAANL